MSTKGSHAEFIDNAHQSIRKKSNNPKEILTRDLNRTFTKSDIQKTKEYVNGTQSYQ